MIRSVTCIGSVPVSVNLNPVGLITHWCIFGLLSFDWLKMSHWGEACLQLCVNRCGMSLHHIFCVKESTLASAGSCCLSSKPMLWKSLCRKHRVSCSHYTLFVSKWELKQLLKPLPWKTRAIDGISRELAGVKQGQWLEHNCVCENMSRLSAWLKYYDYDAVDNWI